MNRKAFTLIELLVVIAIIAILAAILFPVFAQAKSAAKKAACLSNMKQMSTASSLYAGDYDDTFAGNNTNAVWYGQGWGLKKGFLDPDAGQNWGASLYPYIKSVDMYGCPVVSTIRHNEDWGASLVQGAGNTTFIYNGAVQYKSITQSHSPANLVVFRENDSLLRITVGRPYGETVGAASATCGQLDAPYVGVGHDGATGGNNAFADGHAKYYKRTAMTYGMLGLTDTTIPYYTMSNSGDAYANGKYATWVTGDPDTIHLLDASINFWIDWRGGYQCSL